MNDSTASTEGAWIFLSHSHKDLVKVRQIRDELERKGHNPLIFFLKCLEDDRSELPDLLRREIVARTWFILCDSPNSRASIWVQEEVEKITSLEGKVYEFVDLSQDLQTQLNKLTDLSRRATVFLSYARTDEEVAGRVGATLMRADFRVYQGFEVQRGEDFQFKMQTAIDESIANGFVLVLLSPNSVGSLWCKAETLYALRKAKASGRSNVIPIIVHDMDKVLGSLPAHLATLQCFDLTSADFDQRMEELIRALKTREME